MYTCIFLNVTYSDHMLLLVCMFVCFHLALDKQLMWNFLGNFTPSQAPLVACNSLCGVEATQAFPIHLGMSVGVIHVQLTVEQPCWGNLMGAVSDVTRRHVSQQTPHLWFLLSCCLLYWHIFWALGECGVFCRVGLAFTNLHFDWLWLVIFFFLVPVQFKFSFKAFSSS